MKDEKQAEFYL